MHEEPPALPQDTLERAARTLCLLGMVPLIVLALWLAAIESGHVWRSGTMMLLCAYAAVLLSFLGGVRWGLAMARPAGGRRDIALSALPALAAWLSFAVPVPHVFALLAAAFAAQGAWDALSAHAATVPPWYGRLRMALTGAVVAAMILGFVATA